MTGVQQADVPSEIAAEGLQIKLTGQSSEVQMVNFNVSSSVIYSYIVVPLKTGNLTIPPVTVRAEGQVMKTTPLSLAVIGSGTTTPNTSSQAPPSMGSLAPSASMATQRNRNKVDRDHLGFAEIVIPKKKFYAGEVVPVQIRFYVDAHYGFSTMGPPNFGGEGVLTDRFKDPEQSREERDGFIYNVATFRTLFAAVKPGVLDISPATLDIAVAIPEPMPGGMDADLFSRLLGGRSPFVREQKMQLKTSVTHCEVMPLPAEGRPVDFSGAIGQFRLEGSVAPQQVAQGDPVVLSLKLSGQGNFQALKGPQLTETQGWRTYPPADHFEANDIFGWRGVKTFETTMIAQQPVTATPGSSFSYFDPVATKYVTLTTKPLPVQITGVASTPAPASTTVAAAATATNSPSPAPALLLGERLKEQTQHAWKDPLHRKEWVLTWLACFCATLGLVGIFGARAYAKRGRSPRELEEQQLANLMAELEQEELSMPEFYERAAAAAELLLKRGVVEKEDLEEILQRRDEIHYGARVTFLTTAERERVIGILKNLAAKNSKEKINSRKRTQGGKAVG
ncbi:MAG: protein BatD [Verrucomicrobia bacterium]|nr:protein BatD [Verrucomicrobiota bacterium]